MSQIFREKNLKRAQSLDELQDIMEINKPFTWLVIVAALLLLGGFLVWGIFGTIPDKIDVKVLVREDTGAIYLDAEAANKIKIGTKIKIEGQEFFVKGITDKPLSKEDVELIINDKYTFEKINPSTWSTAITFDVSKFTNGVYSASLIISETKPLSFVFN